MSEKSEHSLAPAQLSNDSAEYIHPTDRPDLTLPNDVKNFLKQLFLECNRKISFQLSMFPNAHEESLDLLFISHFAHMQGAIKFDSNWTLRIDAHFIGGGRHFRTWEVADIGLMVMFRKNGRITRSKLAFLQSKKLYASPLKYKPQDPHFRAGLGRLLVTEEEHCELVKTMLLKYSEKSKYKALKLKSEQEGAMSMFSSRHNITLHYLLYNPSLIPWEIKTPVEGVPTIDENKVGCRVISKPFLDTSFQDKQVNYAPSYKDIRDAFKKDFSDQESVAGWKMENFICDLFINGKEGLVDDSPNFQTMLRIMSQKTSPISSALSITFDFEE
ncbi:MULTISPECIES: hypothetical protein [Trichocoleus]|uniref:Uncharacterized protein n=1 Tax=Trichocoleus desertorum GB2-A4 TaxID=2933944 RepID=A0ABV0JF73_9CYAN|nr:hypothetical protein [Trichocoleus sp. FACHB-46]MBD1862354.1 hypothetical protein [Trichocoleus sp. FACHB-46]